MERLTVGSGNFLRKSIRSFIPYDVLMPWDPGDFYLVFDIVIEGRDDGVTYLEGDVV